MQPRDWKSALGIAANVAVIMASVAVVIAVVADLRPHRPGAPAPAERISSLKAGIKAPAIPGVTYAGSERTLLLFLSVHCQYCRQSVPFFRDLAASAATAPGKAGKRRVLAVFPEGADEIAQFEEREGFRVEAASGFRLEDFAVSGTPTAVLISGQGRILQVWHGAPTREAQETMRRALLSD